MKRITYRNKEYYWNELFDFIFLPVSYPARKREKIYRCGTSRYNQLASLIGWKRI